MKILLGVVALAVLAGCGSELKYSDEIVFHGTLVEEIGKPADCGPDAWAVVHKFTCDKIYVGKYNRPFIYVAQNCSDLMADTIIAMDRKFQIAVSVKNKYKWEVRLDNKYKAESPVVFWLKDIEEIVSN